MTALSIVERLLAATNARDANAIADCFTPDYVNETPAHPARAFTGSEQVRKNWTAILAGVPDHRAELLRASADGEVVWSEWRMSGPVGTVRSTRWPAWLCSASATGVPHGVASIWNRWT